MKLIFKRFIIAILFYFSLGHLVYNTFYKYVMGKHLNCGYLQALGHAEFTSDEVLEYSPDDILLAKENKLKFIPGLKNPCFLVNNCSSKNRGFHCLPYFFLAGCEKCGSTDLAVILANHHHIFRPTYNKETHWFTEAKEGSHQALHHNNIRGYASLFDNNTFPDSNGTSEIYQCLHETGSMSLCPYIMGDFTPRYMHYAENWKNKSYHSNATEPMYLIPHKIYAMNPNSKIIFIVRDPTERLFSSYKYYMTGLTRKNIVKMNASSTDFHERASGQINAWNQCLTFGISLRNCLYGKTTELGPLTITERHLWGKDNLNQIRVGLYYYHIEEWLKVFPKRQVLIVNLEDYSKDKMGTLENVILPFLGVEHYKPNEELYTLLHNQRNSRNVSYSMFSETRNLLNNFYALNNEKLSKLLSEWGYD